MANEYDVVVIGAGTGGYPAAIRASQLGLKVAVVERQKALGGTCLIWGCIPTKALLEHAHALKVAQGAKEWGLNLDVSSLRLDMKQVQARKDKVVTTLTKGVEFLFRKNKIDWIKGTARLAGNGRVEVSGEQAQTLQATREIIVATGSQPRSVPGVEIDRKRIITSDEAIGLREVPKSIVILGAGAVGVEFGSLFRAYGSEVTIVELLPRLVPIEDEAVSAELQKAFKKRGIRTFTGSKVTAAQASDEGVGLDVEVGEGKTEHLQADYLLVATGRGPVTEGLGAEEAGIRLQRGYILVDQYFRTGVEGISAVGDVITFEQPGHPQLAHVSTAEGIAVAERIAGQPPRTINYDQVPGCTFCDPEIGSIGLTEQKARERGYDVNVSSFPFMVLGRAKIAGETEGFVKIVAEKKYDEVLGVHIIGPRATDIIAEASVALRLECTGEELVRTIHAHPTFAEAVGEASHGLHGGAIHI
ncbi:MAG TPA: dihydrolipoyl dehydrogenase [Vicinamibacterales bacterium]|nr:dihydrolipoyl dehydrogenase [Vicinamibacterales bacterium]